MSKKKRHCYQDLRRMNARDHARLEVDREQRRPRHDVAPIPDILARAPHVPMGDRGDECGLRAVLREQLRTPVGPLAACAVEQPLRKPTGDKGQRSTLCRADKNDEATVPSSAHFERLHRTAMVRSSKRTWSRQAPMDSSALIAGAV